MVRFLLLFVTTYLAACSFYVETTPEEAVTLFQAGDVFSPQAEPLKTVIRSDADWEDLITSYPTVRSEYVADRFRHVDFDRHMVIGVALGEREDSGIRVNIDSIRVENQRMVIYPSENLPLEQTLDRSNPAHFVVISRSTLPVWFEDPIVRRGS